MTSQLKPDPQMIHETLKVLGVGPNHVTELRILNARDQPNSQYPHTFGGYFDNPDALVKAACSIKYASRWYVVLNPCHPDVMARFCNRAVKLGKGDSTQDHEVIRRVWLPIDTDPARLSRISSTDEEHQLALDRSCEIAQYLRGQGWPNPVVADSGNGGHLLYPITLPREDAGLVERCLKALDQRFSDEKVKVDTSVSNPSRIWKLYGTPACKGDSTPNRPHRMARLLEVPGGL